MSYPQIKNLMSDLKLGGMLQAVDRSLMEATQEQWAPTELIDALLQAEYDFRQHRRTQRLLKNSKLKLKVALQDFDFTTKRSLGKAQVKELFELNWLKAGQPIVIMGPTGIGKTFLAQALGHHACQNKYSTLFLRISSLMENLSLARSSGTYLKFKEKLIKPHLLILDDFGLAKLNTQQAHDLLEILEERTSQTSTILTTQLPLDHWSEVIEDPVIADGIIDRLIHTALKLELKGESYRKIQAKQFDQKTLTQ